MQDPWWNCQTRNPYSQILCILIRGHSSTRFPGRNCATKLSKPFPAPFATSSNRPPAASFISAVLKQKKSAKQQRRKSSGQSASLRLGLLQIQTWWAVPLASQRAWHLCLGSVSLSDSKIFLIPSRVGYFLEEFYRPY